MKKAVVTEVIVVVSLVVAINLGQLGSGAGGCWQMGQSLGVVVLESGGFEQYRRRSRTTSVALIRLRCPNSVG